MPPKKRLTERERRKQNDAIIARAEREENKRLSRAGRTLKGPARSKVAKRKDAGKAALAPGKGELRFRPEAKLDPSQVRDYRKLITSTNDEYDYENATYRPEPHSRPRAFGPGGAGSSKKGLKAAKAATRVRAYRQEDNAVQLSGPRKTFVGEGNVAEGVGKYGGLRQYGPGPRLKLGERALPAQQQELIARTKGIGKIGVRKGKTGTPPPRTAVKRIAPTAKAVAKATPRPRAAIKQVAPTRTQIVNTALQAAAKSKRKPRGRMNPH